MAPNHESGGRRIPTPSASRRTHLLAASLLWSLVGLGLVVAGCIWVFGNRSPVAPLVLIPAAGIGLLKAHFILSRSARRITDRIESRGDDRCIGGFFSWKTWVLALAMALFGRLLRASPLPILARGALYVAIGSGLLAASRLLWARWWTYAGPPRS